MTTLNEQLLEQLQTIVPNLEGIEIPPKVFLDMDAEFVDWNPEGKRLSARFPVKERYQNPLGVMQGGMVVAAIDNVFGPLSYLIAPPSLTTQLNTNFISSIQPEDAYIQVTAQVEEQTRRFLFMSARVTNPEGKILALSQASHMILRGSRK